MSDLPKDVEEAMDAVFNDWPEEIDAGSEFFFVGGATKSASHVTSQHSLSSQLMGIENVADLKVTPTLGSRIEVKDDLESFVVDRVEIVSDSQYEDLFFVIKNKVYTQFDFLRILSSYYGDVPLTARDLVLNASDSHLIDYLKNVTKDYFAVSHVAYLYALDTMGIDTVRFVEVDSCPVCKAHNGVLYSVRNLLNVFSSGEFLTHPYCECKWEPIIYREKYEGPLQGGISLDAYDYEGLSLVGVPVEMKGQIESALEGGLSSVSTVKFINIKDYVINEVEGVHDASGIVVVEHKDTLVVHNSYVDVYGPSDFILEFRRSKAQPTVADVVALKGSQVYFIGGKSAYQHEGRYWDSNTGECLS